MLDKNLMLSHFTSLSSAPIRDILFLEYMEELTSAIVGPTRVMRYFMECFQGQTYQVTKVGTDEHQKLWQHMKVKKKSTKKAAFAH